MSRKATTNNFSSVLTVSFLSSISFLVMCALLNGFPLDYESYEALYWGTYVSRECPAIVSHDRCTAGTSTTLHTVETGPHRDSQQRQRTAVVRIMIIKHIVFSSSYERKKTSEMGVGMHQLHTLHITCV